MLHDKRGHAKVRYNLVLAKSHKPTLRWIENLPGIMLSIWGSSTWLHKVMWLMEWFVNVEGKDNKQQGIGRFVGVGKGNVMQDPRERKCYGTLRGG